MHQYLIFITKIAHSNYNNIILGQNRKKLWFVCNPCFLQLKLYILHIRLQFLFLLILRSYCTPPPSNLCVCSIPCAFPVTYYSSIWQVCHLRCRQYWGIKILSIFLINRHVHKLTSAIMLFSMLSWLTFSLLKTVDTYYRWSSCASNVKDISVPLLCISSLDDPVCTAEAIPWDECR